MVNEAGRIKKMVNEKVLYVKNIEHFDLLRADISYKPFGYVVLEELPSIDEIPKSIIKDGKYANSVVFDTIENAKKELSIATIIIGTSNVEKTAEISKICRLLDLPYLHYDIVYRQEFSGFLLDALGINCTKDDMNNTVKIAPKKTDKNFIVKFSKKIRNSSVTIGESLHIKNQLLISVEGSGAFVYIGKRNFIGTANIYCGAKGIVSIDDDSIIADKVILKQVAGKGDIIVKRHVFIGSHSLLLGGTYIHPEVVIKANSVISSVYFKNLLISGNPAGIFGTDINWTRNLKTQGITQRFVDGDFQIGIITKKSKFPELTVKDGYVDDFFSKIAKNFIATFAVSAEVFEVFSDNGTLELYAENDLGGLVLDVAKLQGFQFSAVFSSKKVQFNSFIFDTVKYDFSALLKKSDTAEISETAETDLSEDILPTPILVCVPENEKLKQEFLSNNYNPIWILNATETAFNNALSNSLTQKSEPEENENTDNQGETE